MININKLFHKNILDASVWAEEIPSESKVMHALNAKPDSLRARRGRRTVNVAAQFRDHIYHLRERRWPSRRMCTTNNAIDRFPLSRFKDSLATDIRTTTPQTSKIESSP